MWCFLGDKWSKKYTKRALYNCCESSRRLGIFFLQTINTPSSSIIKRELLFIPFFGWALACLKPIHLKRSNKFRSFKTVINKGSKKIAKGTSLIIFPEGTRSKPEDGLRPFSNSCGVLSVNNNIPVIPICHNSGLYWRNKSFIKKPGVIKIRIGKPIYGDNPKNVTKDVKLDTIKF